MRLFTSALASAIAVGVLAGCSGGLGNSVPTSSIQSVAPAGKFSYRMVSGAYGDAKTQCPSSKYFLCVTVAKGKPASEEICLSSNSGCTSGSFPPYTWKQKIVTLQGKPFKSIVGSIKPKKGNPITDTITEKGKVGSSKGKVKYVQDITACPASGSCVKGDVGIITK
ncbi:MAG TPA: hypothetical protein VGG51_07790 [Candidatus Cybelea sp.]|jgi:hypothetical protein